MRPLDLDQLRSFVAVVEAGSLSAGAPRVFRSQSAVSEQVRKLEAFTGVTLLDRGKKGVTLTPGGHRLLAHARTLLSLSARALEEVRGISLEGELRLAITDYYRPGAIAEMLKRLRIGYPRLRLHVEVRKSLQIEAEAGGDSFDIGLSMRILDGRATPEGIPLRREALRWVAAPSVEIDNDGPLPLVLLPDGCQLQSFVRQTLDTHHEPYVIAHSASGVAGLQSALVAGLGISCLNLSAVPDGVGAWRLAQSLPPLPDVEFSLLPPRRGESALVGEVRDLLAEQLT
ncbi:MAG: LysR family transcriptional regulator [Thalassobaculaceae bacterium]|nr:LysR family transcriptional regulator [Thalassobaculaceae bacterium]